MELALACLFCLLVGFNIGVVIAFKIIKSNPAIIAQAQQFAKPVMLGTSPAVPRKV